MSNWNLLEEVDPEESEFAKEWLKWCRQSKNVKCTEAVVPPGVLPFGYSGILVDVKVHGKGPDDKIYAQHPELRKKVARGNCVLELTKMGTGETVYIFLVFALKKFSGGMGDEDDCESVQNMWQNYFLQDKDTAVRVICTRKANGEAAHISARKLFGQNYFCLGSKNVHMLVKSKDEIANYNDGRYMVARTVAETFFEQIVENPATKLEDLLQYLNEEKCTMVEEILQPKYQHIENLSYLEKPQLMFICWTSYKMIADVDSKTLCALPPDAAIKTACDFGVLSVDYEEIEAQKAEDYMAKIRSEFEYEGKVLYFIDENDNVIGVIKKKTAWYIVLRAIREKACHFCSPKNSASNSEKRTKISKRICEIQGWVGFSDEYRNIWMKLGTEFVLWLSTGKNKYGVQGVRSQFPILWKTFLEGHHEFFELYNSLQRNYN